MIYLGADHRGFELKEALKKRLIDEGLEITDLGNDHLDPNDDYVDFATKVAHAVTELPENEYDSSANEHSSSSNEYDSSANKGILLCGSGVGVDIVANKIDGVRCALVDDVARAIQSREHEDANVLALPADKLDSELAYDIAKAFLNTEFSYEGRHERRLEKLEEIEEES